MRTVVGLLSFLLPLAVFSQMGDPSKSEQVTLPNGWKLTPVGRSIPLGDLPLNVVVSPSKKYIAVTNNGQSVQSIQLIDTKTEKILHSEVILKSWFGLAFSADEKFLYASGGNDNWILNMPSSQVSLYYRIASNLEKNGRKKYHPLVW